MFYTESFHSDFTLKYINLKLKFRKYEFCHKTMTAHYSHRRQFVQVF
jgi:hypothetical protein